MSESLQDFHNATARICVRIPPAIYSRGIQWGTNTIPNTRLMTEFLSYPLPLLELQMLLIFLITTSFHFLLKRIGIPVFVSQLLAGIILGPSCIGGFPKFKQALFPREGQEAIAMIANFGYLMHLFIMGVKTDPKVVASTGKLAIIIGVASNILPMAVGGFYVQNFSSNSNMTKGDKLRVTAIQSMTSFPVIRTLLVECGALNTELGRLSISASVVSNMLGLFMTFCFTASRHFTEHDEPRKGIVDIVAITGFLAFAAFVIRRAMFWIIRHTPEDRPVKNTYIQVILVIVLGSAVYTKEFDQLVLLGPLLLGLAMPDGPPLGSQLIEKFDYFISGVFVPLFVTTAAMRVDLSHLTSNRATTKHCLMVVTLAGIFKFFASVIPPLWTKMPIIDAVMVGFIMSYHSVVELAAYTYSKDIREVTEETFSFMTVYLLVYSAAVSILMKYNYKPSRKYVGHQKRNIMHVKPNSELRILTCIHKPEDVAATIRLLDASYPTQENPIGIYVLHLIELGCRSAPVFVTHQLKKTMDVHPYSQNVNLAFAQYERTNWGYVSVNTFTAMSPTELMHEDITTLALNRATSLIILPFHRKWSIDGTIASEDNLVRGLNCRVLEVAPCSVGILIDRPQVRKSAPPLRQLMRRTSSNSTGRLLNSMPSAQTETPYSIGMIFIGGKDDREALTFAKRMAKDSAVTLTVTRFLSGEATEDDAGVVNKESEEMDDEVLEDVKQNNVGEGYVIYVEEIAKDGPETATSIRQMAEEYDLIVAGRQHGIENAQTSGLSEWCEFEELGIIGDLLASPDLSIRASVLVIQQQT